MPCLPSLSLGRLLTRARSRGFRAGGADGARRGAPQFCAPGAACAPALPPAPDRLAGAGGGAQGQGYKPFPLADKDGERGKAPTPNLVGAGREQRSGGWEQELEAPERPRRPPRAASPCPRARGICVPENHRRPAGALSPCRGAGCGESPRSALPSLCPNRCCGPSRRFVPDVQDSWWTALAPCICSRTYLKGATGEGAEVGLGEERAGKASGVYIQVHTGAHTSLNVSFNAFLNAEIRHSCGCLYDSIVRTQPGREKTEHSTDASSAPRAGLRLGAQGGGATLV